MVSIKRVTVPFYSFFLVLLSSVTTHFSNGDRQAPREDDVLYGILLDVSGSMKEVFDVKNDNASTARIHVAFDTLRNLSKSDGTASAKFQSMFAITFGNANVDTCNLYAVLDDAVSSERNSEETQRNAEKCKKRYSDGDLEHYINELDSLAKQNEVYNLRGYLNGHIEDHEARLFLIVFCTSPRALKNAIELLPDIAKKKSDVFEAIEEVAQDPFAGKNFLEVLNRAIITSQNHVLTKYGPVRAKINEIQAVLVQKEVLDFDSICNERSVPYIQPVVKWEAKLRELLKAGDLSAGEVSGQIVKIVEPYIYGSTPMCAALRDALLHFGSYASKRKILFILSDGLATDCKSHSELLSIGYELRKKGVIIVSCYITSTPSDVGNPRRLHYELAQSWSEGAKNLFALSSSVHNSHPGVALVKDKLQWQIPSAGESRLFLQVNHPEILSEFNMLVKKLGDSAEARYDFTASFEMDIYINSAHQRNFKIQQQEGGTCYAHAIAAVFHMAMLRIYQREGGVPSFQTIKDKLIEEYGYEGAYTQKVLEAHAKRYRLRYEEVTEEQARHAINSRRPVVAIFRLDDMQWSQFSEFYDRSPNGTVTSSDLKQPSWGSFLFGAATTASGHAWVLTRIEPSRLQFMNSWGGDFGDGGYVYVENGAISFKFFDVFWYESDLTSIERDAFKQKGAAAIRHACTDILQGHHEITNQACKSTV